MPKIDKQAPKGAAKAKPSTNLLDNAIDVSELAASFIRMTVWGMSGSGKTAFASSFPKPAIILGTEDGTRTVRNVKGLTFLRINSCAEYTQILQELREKQKFKTVILDTASKLQELDLCEELGLTEIPTQKSWGFASREQYAAVAMRTKTYLRDTLSLPAHTIIIAQEREFEPAQGTEAIIPHVGAMLMPSVSGWLYPETDYIVQTFIREKYVEQVVKVAGKETVQSVKCVEDPVEFCLRLQPHPIYTVKFRSPVGTKLPPIIVDPTYDKLQQYL